MNGSRHGRNRSPPMASSPACMPPSASLERLAPRRSGVCPTRRYSPNRPPRTPRSRSWAHPRTTRAARARRTTGVDVPQHRAGRRALWGGCGAIRGPRQPDTCPLPSCRRRRWSSIGSATPPGTAFRSGSPFTRPPATWSSPLADTVFGCQNLAVLRAAAGELRNTSAALACTEGVACVCAQVGWRRRTGRASAALARRLRLGGPACHRGRCDPPRRSVLADRCPGLRAGSRPWGVPGTGSSADSPWGQCVAQTTQESGSTVMEERLLPALACI